MSIGGKLNGASERIPPWLRSILIFLVLPLLVISATGLFAWAMSLERWKAATTANRWTSKDQESHVEKQADEFHRVWQALGAKADKDKVPPPEVVTAIEDLRRRIYRIEDRFMGNTGTSQSFELIAYPPDPTVDFPPPRK